MIFNSIEFAAFFVLVFGSILLLPHKWQNRMLLAASYYFYGAWDWRFLFLIWITTGLDYFCGLRIDQAPDRKTKKFFLLLSVCTNLSILGFFKYTNFFMEGFQDLLGLWGISFNPFFLSIMLPVGVSFYTFKTLSYTIDIYRGQMKATNHLIDFALFIAFFPQLLAGPIERARRFLPQIQNPRRILLEDVYQGGFLIFWGLFQKIFIADNLSRIVDPVFSGGAPYDGLTTAIAVYAFTFEIYCDFAGYSNMAIGLGKCLGFDTMINFNLPYFSTSPQEFWRRWHISLSQWLRDYLYISLGGNRKGVLHLYRNLFLTMVLGGLWHGAAWTFVFWGAYHGILLVFHRLAEPILKFISPENRLSQTIWWWIRVIFCFHLIAFGWMIFRAESMPQVWAMVKSMGNPLVFNEASIAVMKKLLFFLSPLVMVQVYQYCKNDLMAVYRSPAAVRSIFYFLCIYLAVVFGAEGGKEFIYFQF